MHLGTNTRQLKCQKTRWNTAHASKQENNCDTRALRPPSLWNICMSFDLPRVSQHIDKMSNTLIPNTRRAASTYAVYLQTGELSEGHEATASAYDKYYSKYLWQEQGPKNDLELICMPRLLDLLAYVYPDNRVIFHQHLGSSRAPLDKATVQLLTLSANIAKTISPHPKEHTRSKETRKKKNPVQ